MSKTTIDLQGKVALVTGASRGIGRETALRMGEAAVILFLASPMADYLNGVTIDVNGGSWFQ